jgi:hypothetical protein
MGYSGGALASGWALQQQKEYAPELSSNLVAAALGGLPVNVEDILLKLNGGPMAGRESRSLVEERPPFTDNPLSQSSCPASQDVSEVHTCVAERC